MPGTIFWDFVQCRPRGSRFTPPEAKDIIAKLWVDECIIWIPAGFHV